jgi:hypothetical protein
MDLFHYLFIAMAALVGAQIVMTRLYGWRGLASTTTVLVVSILGGPATLFAWLNSHSDIVPPPRQLAELGTAFIFFMPSLCWCRCSLCS